MNNSIDEPSAQALSHRPGKTCDARDGRDFSNRLAAGGHPRAAEFERVPDEKETEGETKMR